MKIQPHLEHAELTGSRVRLRPIRSEDATLAFPLIHRREPILEWLVWDGPESVDDLAARYARWAVGGERGWNYLFAIVDGARGTFCGSISLRFGDHPFAGDLGYWLAEDAWGTGRGSEAVALACDLAFGPLEAALVYGEVFEGNVASRRILEKCGFTQDYVGLRGTRRLEHLALSRSSWPEGGLLPRARIEVEFG